MFLENSRLRRALTTKSPHQAALEESLDFLLDNADRATLEELNEKLNYWRVVLEAHDPDISS